MLTSKKDKLQDIVSCVKCPLNAMIIENEEIFCTKKAEVSFRTSTGNISLGDIKEDILNYCGNCKFKNEDKNKEIKSESVNIQIDESACLPCKATGKDVSFDTCKTCLFLDKKKMQKYLEENPEGDLTFISCFYPNIPEENKKVFLSSSQKKAIAALRKSKEKAT